jgi:tight adherence protein B
MRRLASALAAIAVALVATAAATAAVDQPKLTPLKGIDFPDRAYILSLPRAEQLSTDSFEIRENDVIVPNAYVVPANAAGRKRFGIVLAIDASDSMRGRAIFSAVAAARAFAGQRNPNQQLAVVTFNGATDVLLPLTTSKDTIDEALARPPLLATGTKIYDGVGTALDVLRKAKIAGGAVVVLSDGADTASDATAAQIAARANRDGVRIYTVGLRSKQFDAAALADLAGRAGGEYAEAGSAATLAAIYKRLGAVLANQYLIRYRSPAGGNKKVTVEVRAAGYPDVATIQYKTPTPPDSVQAPFHRSALSEFWRSPGAMVAISFFSALLIATGLVLIARPGNRSIRKRMAEFVSIAPPRREEPVNERRGRLFESAPSSVATSRWWTRLEEALEIADIKLSAWSLLLLTVLATVVVVLLLALVSLFFAPLGLLVPLLVKTLVERQLDRKRKQFAEQLPDNLQVLASAMRAGHSFIGALSVVVEDAAEPSCSEFKRVIADEQLGVPLEQALGVVVRRMDNRDLEQISVVAVIQRESGGNTAEVLDRVAETVRERFELRRLVSTLTAQGRLSRWVVTLLPVALILVITLINPDYMRPLWTRPAGQALLAVSVAFVVTGSLVIRRIVNIKV